MKKLSRPLMVLGTAIASMALFGCGGGASGPAAPVVDDSPEGQAFQYRQAVMRVIAYKVAKLRGMTNGDVPADDAAFAQGAKELVALASMVPEGFIPNSGSVAGTAALPEIWTNSADFAAKAADFQNAANALAEAAPNGVAAAGPAVQAIGQTCGGCHRPYRRRQEQ